MPIWERYLHTIIQEENKQIHIIHHIIILELYIHIYIFFTCFDNIYVSTVFLWIYCYFDKLSIYNWTFILLQLLIIIDLYTLSSIRMILLVENIQFYHYHPLLYHYPLCIYVLSFLYLGISPLHVYTHIQTHIYVYIYMINTYLILFIHTSIVIQKHFHHL